MRLTTKGRYAVTAMLDLAIHTGQKPVTLAEISGRQEISLSYIEQLFAKLRKHGLVKSIRGPGGGYLLGRDIDDIHIAEIVDAVDETLDSTQCHDSGSGCQRGKRCLTHHLWMDLSAQIHDFLSGISLHDLMDNEEVLDVARRQDEDVLARVH